MTDLASDFHEVTDNAAAAASSAASSTDIRHKNPHDRHKVHIWMYEEPVATGVLTQDGITQIAHHQYVPGVYTTLDIIINPIWAYLTDLLPMTMAPNMVTTIGGMHCVVAYIVTWMFGTEHYRDSDVETIPSWLYVFNAYCMIAYYTFDCMDGKQARRTGTSSPLGQLFDHGMDSLCLQQHLAMVMVWALPGSKDDTSKILWYFGAQAALQLTFFAAQWEEYYTGQFPHAAGNVGVTEVNYGLAVWSLTNAVMDRSIYSHPLKDFIPINPTWIEGYQLKHMLLTLWYLFTIWQISMAFIRVNAHLQDEANTVKLSAVTKWTSPLLIALTPFILPADIVTRETRFISLSIGLALTFITNKLIVFGMARQPYAVFQFPDVLLIVIPSIWIANDPRWTEHGIHAVYKLLAIHFAIRILRWTRAATGQICQRMDIYLFTIKHPKGEETMKKAE